MTEKLYQLFINKNEIKSTDKTKFFIDAFSTYVGKLSSNGCEKIAIPLNKFVQQFPDGFEIKIKLHKSEWITSTEKMKSALEKVISKNEKIANAKKEIELANLELDGFELWKSINPPENKKGRKPATYELPDNLFV